MLCQQRIFKDIDKNMFLSCENVLHYNVSIFKFKNKNYNLFFKFEKNKNIYIYKYVLKLCMHTHIRRGIHGPYTEKRGYGAPLNVLNVFKQLYQF